MNVCIHLHVYEFYINIKHVFMCICICFNMYKIFLERYIRLSMGDVVDCKKMITNSSQSWCAWPFATWLCCSSHWEVESVFAHSQSFLARLFALTNRMPLKWCQSSAPRKTCSFHSYHQAKKPPWRWERSQVVWQPEQSHLWMRPS